MIAPERDCVLVVGLFSGVRLGSSAPCMGFCNVCIGLLAYSHKKGILEGGGVPSEEGASQGLRMLEAASAVPAGPRTGCSHRWEWACNSGRVSAAVSNLRRALLALGLRIVQYHFRRWLALPSRCCSRLGHSHGSESGSCLSERAFSPAVYRVRRHMGGAGK